jgi:outer membrane receptor protein involved in Fe transport
MEAQHHLRRQPLTVAKPDLGEVRKLREGDRLLNEGKIVGRALIDAIFFPGLIDRSPTPAQVQAILASAPGSFFENFTGVPFNPATDDLLAVFPGLVLFDNRRYNIGLDDVSGIDLLLSASLPLGPGELTLGLNGTYYLDFDRRTTAASPAFSQLNQPGRPVDLRFRANAGWTSGPWGLFTYLNYTDGYRDTFMSPEGRIDSWTTLDVAVRFDGSRLGSPGFLRGLSITASIDNLFDADPPVFLSNILGLGYDPANASPVGRFFAVRATKRW